ncbi:MAG: helix-turn-helix transcriptional regulator, partial [Chloroflexota bacterium]
YDLTTTPPFAPWTEILRSASEVKDLPPTLERLLHYEAQDSGDGEHPELLGQFERYIDELAEGKPTVLVLEDLHWADAASQDLLRALSRRVDQIPVLLVGTYRDDEMTRDGYLYRLLPHIVRESRALRTTLQRLDRDSTRTIVEDRYELDEPERDLLTGYLHQLSDGNPFFIRELLNTLEEENLLRQTPRGWTLEPLETPVVPPLVEQIVEGRLGRLDATTRELLEMASVIGDAIHLDVWQALSGVDSEQLIKAVRDAERSKLLEESPDGSVLRFSHAIVREVLYKRVVLPQRRLLHRQSAEYMQESPAPNASLIGHHFALAEDPRAVDWLLRAARRANAFHAPQTVIDTVTELVRLSEKFDAPVSSEALAIRGQARSQIGDFEGAREDYEHVLGAAQVTGNYEWVGQPYISLGMLWADRNSQQLDQYLHAALDRAREQNEQGKIAHSLNRLGNRALYRCRPDEAAAHHEEALSITQAIGDLEATATSLEQLGMAHMIRGDLVQAAGCYQRASELFTTLNKPYHVCYNLANLLNCTMSLANDTLVLASANTTDLMDPEGPIIQMAREGGWVLRELYGLMILSLTWGYQGEYGTALELGRRGMVLAEEAEHRQWSAHSGWRMGLLYLDVLASEEAVEHLERSLELSEEIGAEIHQRASVGLLASAYLSLGELDRVEETLGDFDPVRAAPPRTNQDRYSWCACIDLLLARGDPERALLVVDKLIGSTPNLRPDQTVARLAKLRGEALVALERFEEAEVELRRARTEAGRLRARPMLWRIDALLSHLFEARNNGEGARMRRRSAARIIDELARPIPDEDLRERFKRRAMDLLPEGEEPPDVREKSASIATLTPREVEVLQLVARGLTDAEVADRLFISPRTVNAHMRSIHRKLDVNSRAAATRFAVQHELV